MYAIRSYYVFNWLTPHLAGSRCLDLFAGSGSLGFEALSRHADYVMMVERDKGAAQQRNNFV